MMAHRLKKLVHEPQLHFSVPTAALIYNPDTLRNPNKLVTPSLRTWQTRVL